MRVTTLLKWWATAMALLLLYAGADAALYPEETRVTLDSLTLTWNPEEPFAWVHAGARLVGALGWGVLVVHGTVVTGFLVAVLALFVEDEE